MLSKTEKRTFQLHKYGFFYLSPFPIVWDKNYTSLQLNYSKWPKRVFKVNIILSVIACMGCIYVLLHHFLIQPIPNYHIGIIGLYIGSVSLIAIPGSALLLWHRHQDALDGINMFLSSTLHKSSSKKRNINYILLAKLSTVNLFHSQFKIIYRKDREREVGIYRYSFAWNYYCCHICTISHLLLIFVFTCRHFLLYYCDHSWRPYLRNHVNFWLYCLSYHSCCSSYMCF